MGEGAGAWSRSSDSCEREILAMLADGLSTKEIAANLGITFKTAACHRSRILSKFGVHNTVTLLRRAIRRGMIQV